MVSEWIGKRVLAVGAHPDDIEMGCGGTIARMNNEGAKVFTVIATKCEDELTKAQKDRRINEYYKAMEILHVHEAYALDYPNRRLPEFSVEITDEFSRLQDKINPDIVFMPFLEDSHQDHSAVAHNAMRSFRRKETIIQYEILRYGSHTFTPNLFVDITDYIDLKIEALNCHKTQKSKRAYFDDETFRGLSRSRGAQAGFDYAEGFVIYKMLW